MELAFIPLGNDKTVQRLCDSSRISDEQILPLPMLAEPIDGIDPSLRGLSLDVWNQIRIETRTAPKRLDELLSLDPEPPRALSDVLDLPFEELTGDPEL